ncbi:MAG: 50S ribosomal protein L6 [Candidatus Wildermuthbacteria bacterium]|nr:50S ribosomal protein L6 [Candidatus Wildermuthbacteria bacterium]
MSRIGKKPIEIPSGVTALVENGELKVRGPKGELSRDIFPGFGVSLEGSNLVITPPAGISEKKSNSLWGLYRSLFSNMIEGVHKGYEKKLEIEGTGYRASVEGAVLNLNLGFSHPVRVDIPKGILCAVDKSVISVSGIDKEAVGEFAAGIRRLRTVEPYKGKGVRYQGEIVRRKEGKKAATAGSS